MALCSSPVSHILRFTMMPSVTNNNNNDDARNNYTIWSVCMKNYLLGQGLWDIIEESSEPKPADSSWRKRNAIALLAIQNSCESDIIFPIREINSAKIAWDTLAKIYEPEPPAVNSGQPGDPANPIAPQVAVPNQGDQNNENLYNAIKKGNLNDVQDLIKRNPNALKAQITPTGMTSLHVACNAGHLNIIEELVQFMSAEDLAIQNQFGETALCNVAMVGITKIAERMIEKNRDLARIKNKGGYLPVTLASINGHKDMTRYLYKVTPIASIIEENDNQGPQLIVSSIFSKIYDVALLLLSERPSLATARTCRGTIPLVRLASMPFAFPSGSRLTFWQRWIYSCIHVSLPTASSEVRVSIHENGQSERDNIVQLPVLGQLRGLVSSLLKFIGIKEIYDMKWTHLHAEELLRLMCRELSISNLDVKRDAIFEATRHGIIEFIIEMNKVDPDVLYMGSNSGTIFMSAILHRQEKIFSLLYGLDARKHFFIAKADKSFNNMLHLAGMLAPTSQLARISGAALQMQRELQWYKEVESFLNPSHSEQLNSDNETPRQVFTRKHEKLVKDGEKWMKGTATSYTLVGALIFTVMFATAFTVPGGNNQITGFPIFLHKKLFMIFIISDAISLFSSSTSVMMFLGILTSRYTEDDFLKSLPTKLIIGLSTLFISITTMMIAFSSALLIMLEGQLQIIILIVSLASIPVTLFLCLQFPLLVEIFVSTYGTSIFDRKMKPCL